jgi:hypothetical protein
MPTFKPLGGSERDRNEVSGGLDQELSEGDRDDLFNKLNEMRKKNEGEGLISKDISEENRKSVSKMLNEVEEAGKSGDFANPENPAQVANETLAAENADPGIIVKKGFEKIGEGLPEKEKMKLLLQLAEEHNVAEEGISQKDNPKKGWSKKQWAAVIGGIAAILGLATGLYLYLESKKKKATSETTIANRDGLEPIPDFTITAEASQTFISLLMQAASDVPYNSLAFKDFGISASTYQSLRGQLLAHRDNISEDAHWQIMAQQTETIFPPTGKTYTLGDHMLALELQFNLLEPLYDTQPLDLDLDTTISTLAEHIDLKAEIPIQKLYNNMMELIPETSGADRLQRLVLARMAIGRAIAKAQPST